MKRSKLLTALASVLNINRNFHGIRTGRYTPKGYNKYTPHQGDQEKDRRRRQLAAGIIKP